MAASLTPMMRQYHAARQELPPNSILLFRLGDFYEMFFEDAKEASAILNVALTKRGDVPMCGVPHHSASSYIQKLIEAGKKVAICEQVGEVQQGKLVRRELSQIISPGTLDDSSLDARTNNYLAAVSIQGNKFGLAWVDLSTGDFRVAEFPEEAALLDELARLSPAELVVQESHAAKWESAGNSTPLEDYIFLPDHADVVLREHFAVHSLDGFGCSEMPAAIGAAGAVLYYLTKQLRRKVDHIRTLRTHDTSDHLILDATTQAHLELVTSRAGRSMTLLGVLDRASTPMGARLLREWLLHPLRSPAEIRRRHDAIESLLNDALVLGELRDALREVRDIERAISRLSQGSGNARDLAALGTSLSRLPQIGVLLEKLEASPDAILSEQRQVLPNFSELVRLLESALADELPATVREGGMIRDGYHPQLDELRLATREGKEWVAGLQEREIARTGVKSLKVRYNSVFGYYIEVTKANLGSVPDDYIRKQTTVNGERFITPELKEIEGKILGAEERAKALEYEIFQELRQKVLEKLADIQKAARAVAIIDALGSLAETARLYGYCRPAVDDSSVIKIEEGRHPVLDQPGARERFVPNDVFLDAEKERLLIITGPNMAGKSTFIRQTALLVIMAQMGSFVPAASAHVGVVDRIFTRVGASDDLSRGQSTFMVEMTETANILNNATSKSLVILDEIGRGTSTFDGLSIAWSVAEYLHDTIRARTLFATHYHELTDLDKTCSAVRNYNVAVREWNDQVIFLRKIVPGRADQSYGIQVARLAGLPSGVLARAKEILSNLEKAELNADGKPTLASSKGRSRGSTRDDGSQLSLL